MRRPNFSLIGPGAVGSALACGLAGAGFRLLSVIGKTPAGGRRLAREFKASWSADIAKIHADSELILIAVPDEVIAEVAGDLTRQDLLWKKVAVLHVSGFQGVGVLEKLEELGAGVGACHPFQTFPKRPREKKPPPSRASTPGRNLFEGVTFGIDGNERGLKMARKVARALGGQPLLVQGQQRVLYHLAAVLACGFVSADLLMAQRVLCGIGLSEKRALEAILPIASGTIKNINELGIRAAMTGPAVRGDRATIRKHLRELRKLDPELAKVYGKVSGWMMEQKG